MSMVTSSHLAPHLPGIFCTLEWVGGRDGSAAGRKSGAQRHTADSVCRRARSQGDHSSLARRLPAISSDGMRPPTRYAKSAGGYVAYQVFGKGARDILFVTHWGTNVDAMWTSRPSRTSSIA